MSKLYNNDDMKNFLEKMWNKLNQRNLVSTNQNKASGTQILWDLLGHEEKNYINYGLKITVE